jgi:hypothetical protein
MKSPLEALMGAIKWHRLHDTWSSRRSRVSAAPQPPGHFVLGVFDFCPLGSLRDNKDADELETIVGLFTAGV